MASSKLGESKPGESEPGQAEPGAVRIADLRNLGPASARMLAAVGVYTDADLEALGAARGVPAHA